MAPDFSHDDDRLDAETLAADAASHRKAAYVLVYRAARDAVRDVVGTATLVLFYLALAAIGFSVAFGGIGPFLRGSATYEALAVGVVALAAGLFAAYRVHALATE